MFKSTYEQCTAQDDWLNQASGRNMKTAQVLECLELCTIPIRASQRAGEEASRRNASCEIESFVVSFRGSIVAVRWLLIPFQVPHLSKSDHEGGEPKLIILYSRFVKREKDWKQLIDEAEL